MMVMQKKKHPKFNVPNYGARSRKRVLYRWRKQRGIDNKKRTKKSFMGAEPNIGYGNPESLKGIRANGKRIMLVRNENELKRFIENRSLEGYDVTIAKGLSIRKRIAMTELASRAKINVTNGAYK